MAGSAGIQPIFLSNIGDENIIDESIVKDWNNLKI